MSFITFKLMHTSQRIPLHISILVFTSKMTWLGVFVDIDSQMIPLQCALKILLRRHPQVIYCTHYFFLHLGVHE